mmetsp:Transcript_14393/g.27882  ORF Transcript_14393/g.27882 Transcript_14393/m.27882 type:complete len:80 (+) Transcript_14393:145-384(+)
MYLPMLAQVSEVLGKQDALAGALLSVREQASRVACGAALGRAAFGVRWMRCMRAGSWSAASRLATKLVQAAPHSVTGTC